MLGLILILLAAAGFAAGVWFNQDSWVGIACVLGAAWCLTLVFSRGIRLLGGAAYDRDEKSDSIVTLGYDIARKRHGREDH
ncbi:MAG: hypothetical protein KDE14_12865 [Rhodobacteraceae bacterium]|nr:hypothetical protein [Paracoccaceae bacterium]